MGEGEKYLFSFPLKPYQLEVVYLGELPLPIQQDKDEYWVTEGRNMGSFTIVTCKHIHQMRTIREKPEKPFYEHMKDNLEIIRSYQEEFLRQKEEKKKKKGK